MNQVIIYPNGEGGVAIFSPDPKVAAKHGMYALGRRVVPANVPFKIVDKSELPEDRETRNAWTVYEADLTDGVGNTSNDWD